MAITRIDNVKPEILRWAFQRAGYSEEKAVEVGIRHSYVAKSVRLFPRVLSSLQDFGW